MDAIERFWRFWTENRTAIERALDERTLGEWVEPIGEQVSAIDPELDWEFGAGLSAQHYFCLSGKGDPDKRLIAERWRAAGPEADAVFEFHAARPGGGFRPGTTIEFGLHAVAGEDLRFALETDTARRRVHLTVWHPEFASMPDDLPLTATYIWLDTVLGEDDVERYIGAVELAESEPDAAMSFPALVDAVHELSTSVETFALLRGQLDDGAPIFVTANLGIKRVDHLLMDLHVAIELVLQEPTEQGLTTSEEADRLNESEDALLEALGPDAVYIGRETARGARTLHLHAANGGPAMKRIDAWAASQPWTVDVRAALDPRWDVLGRW